MCIIFCVAILVAIVHHTHDHEPQPKNKTKDVKRKILKIHAGNKIDYSSYSTLSIEILKLLSQKKNKDR